MINLKQEIYDLLLKKTHLSLHQLSLKLKIEHCFILDAIADYPAIKECGKYFNTVNNEIENYYTLSDTSNTELVDFIKREEKVKQVAKMANELIKEIKAHYGNKTTVSAAYDIVKQNSTTKATPNYFLLNKSDLLYAYEIALGKRNLAHNEPIGMNYRRTLDIAA